MKKGIRAVLCVVCAVCFAQLSLAEDVLPVSEFLSSAEIPVEYPAFPSGIPPFPTATVLSEDTVVLTGLKAWGVDPEQLSDWTRDPETREWTMDHSVRYEDEARFFFPPRAPRDYGPVAETPAPEFSRPGSGIQLSISCVGTAYDEIRVNVLMHPRNEDELPGKVRRVLLVRGDLQLEILSFWAYAYMYRLDEPEGDFGFRAEYSSSGELQNLIFCSYTEKRDYRVSADSGSGDRKVFTVSVNSGSVDLNRLPFALVPGAELVPGS